MKNYKWVCLGISLRGYFIPLVGMTLRGDAKNVFRAGYSMRWAVCIPYTIFRKKARIQCLQRVGESDIIRDWHILALQEAAPIVHEEVKENDEQV